MGKVSTVRPPVLREKLVAEFVGTLIFVLTISLSVVGKVSMPPVAIGLMLGIQIYTFGSVSGGFFNPAVTLAVLLSGRNKITPVEASMYMLAQIFGGSLGGIFAHRFANSSFFFAVNTTNASFWADFWIEAIFTAALCQTVLTAGTSRDAPNQYFGFAIGLTVTAGAMACGGFDQGSFNPAVTVGVNVANWLNPGKAGAPDAYSWLLYVLAPFVGSLISVAVFRATRGNEYEGNFSDESSEYSE